MLLKKKVINKQWVYTAYTYTCPIRRCGSSVRVCARWCVKTECLTFSHNGCWRNVCSLCLYFWRNFSALSMASGWSFWLATARFTTCTKRKKRWCHKPVQVSIYSVTTIISDLQHYDRENAIIGSTTWSCLFDHFCIMCIYNRDSQTMGHDPMMGHLIYK